MKLSVSEIINIVAEQDSDFGKVAVLRANDSPPLRKLLRLAYNPRIKWLLPEGDPPYKPLPPHELPGSEMMFWKEARTLYLFVEGDDEFTKVPPQKREMKFIELLEHLHPADAKVLLAAKNRNIPGVPRALVEAAFPGLI